MTNTSKEWELPVPSDQAAPPSPTPLDNVAAKLESELQSERDNKKEERFYWILAVVICIDFSLFDSLTNKWVTAPIFLLQLVLLIGLANYLGVDAVKILLEKLYAKWLRDKPHD